jgi:hypothetical protein
MRDETSDEYAGAFQRFVTYRGQFQVRVVQAEKMSNYLRMALKE